MRFLMKIILCTALIALIEPPTVLGQTEKLTSLKKSYEALLKQKQYEKALPLISKYAQALKAKDSAGSSLEFAHALNKLAETYFHLKEFGKAMRTVRQALTIAEQHHPDHPEVFHALTLMATLYDAQKQPKFASALRNRANSIKERNRPKIYPRQFRTRGLTDNTGELEAPGSLKLGKGSEKFETVTVFYATDRQGRKIENRPKMVYGSEHNTNEDGSFLDLGIAEVSIPKSHKKGVLEAPSIMKLEWTSDPTKHVVLLSVEKKGRESYFDLLRQKIGSSATRNAFIFIHGYNVTFEDAARRTAQIAHDLDFKGAPVFYSWPSRGTTIGYTADFAAIQWTEPHLKEFLVDFLEQSKADNIFVIAHSMGNRALARIIGQVANETPEAKKKIKEIILAAPDIDARVFKDNLAPQMREHYKNITLYASSGDFALIASKIFHLNNPRAGDAGDNLVVTAGIETVDVSGLDSSFLGHTYIAGTPSILSDVNTVFSYGKRAKDRPNLLERDKDGGIYWILNPSAKFSSPRQDNISTGSNAQPSPATPATLGNTAPTKPKRQKKRTYKTCKEFHVRRNGKCVDIRN